ncbi:protein 5NUC-like [Haemaphysalis longicornis]
MGVKRRYLHGSKQAEGNFFSGMQLTILHTNDIHSRILESDKRGRQCDNETREERKCFGGVARITAKVKKLKEEHEHSLFLNAGDFYQGTLWYSILKYNIVSPVMANMSYNYVCLGNHEFDDGPEGLVPFLLKMKESGVTVLGTNLDTKGEPLFANITLPKSELRVINGVKVALLGVVTVETTTIARPGGVKILAEATSINEEIEELKKKGAKIFILVSHVGFDVDQRLAVECKDLDLIVGGHTNTFLYTGQPPAKDTPEGQYPTVIKRPGGKNCYIVQDYRFGKYLGFLQVQINRKTGRIVAASGNPILLDQNVTQDQDMLEALKPYEKIVDDEVKAVVGSSKVLLEADEKVCRHKECNMVNLMADAFFSYYSDKESPIKGSWSTVNGAVLNGGIARDSIKPKENVTLGDLLGAMPYDSDLVIMNMTGYQLRKMFEYGIDNFTWYPDLNGKFLQVAGIRVVYNYSRPNNSRVISMKILCANCSVPVYEDVDDCMQYSIVTSAFIANGGDGYKFDANVTKRTDGISGVDVFVDYFRKMSPVKTPQEGRVIVLELPERPNVTTTCAPIPTTTPSSPVVMSRADWRSMRRSFIW